MVHRKWRVLFLFSVMVSSLLLVISVNSYRWLPRYDLYNFFDDFEDDPVDFRFWAFQNEVEDVDVKGGYSVSDSWVTLVAPKGGVSYLEHSYVTYWPMGVRYGARPGAIEVTFKLIDVLSQDAFHIVRMDGGFVFTEAGNLYYFDEEERKIHLLQDQLDSQPHRYKIVYGRDGRHIYLDGELKVSVSGVDRFTYLILGHSQRSPRSGGSVSFDWVQSSVKF